MKLVIVTSWFFLFLTFGSCSNEKQSNSELPSNVVKVVTTRTYTAKTEFDKLIKDQPAYHMGYGEMFEMDFGWNTKHFDKYGNTVYEEKFTLAKNGEENAGQLRVKFEAMSLCTDLRASLVSFYYFSIVYRDIEPISSMRF